MNDMIPNRELMLTLGRAAREAAKKLEAAAKKGTDLSVAVAQLGLPLPPVDKVDMEREKLQAMGQQTPPPLALLFAAAKGKVGLLAAPRNRGWYVVKVTDVIPGKVVCTLELRDLTFPQLHISRGLGYTLGLFTFWLATASSSLFTWILLRPASRFNRALPPE